ncbi:hypothetical protein LPJ59_000427 [Coemansia sp. RSA 2399]|nr:hypothetical protein LPJ59_000427 [Coemansia sp. RSA 2399]
MTDDPIPVIPPDPAPAPAGPPGPPPCIADGTGPLWSVVAQKGLVQRPPQQRPTGLPRTSYSTINRVSCFNVLMGEDPNMNAQPAKLVSSLPGAFCQGYYAPPSISTDDIMEACCDLPLKCGGMVVMIPHSGITVLSLESAEDLAVASKNQLVVNGVPLQTCRVIEYHPLLARVTVRGFRIPSVNKDSIMTLVRKIDTAMMAFGIVKDLIISVIRKGNGNYFILDNASVTILLNDEKNLPSTITIDKTTVTLSGKKVEPYCVYCKQTGHIRDKCPTRPQNKKHGQEETVDTEVLPGAPAPAVPPQKRPKKAKKQLRQQTLFPPPSPKAHYSVPANPPAQPQADAPATSSTAQDKQSPTPPAQPQAVVPASPSTTQDKRPSTPPASSPRPAASTSISHPSPKCTQATLAFPSTNLPANNASPKQSFVTAIVSPVNIPKSPAPPVPTKAADKAPAQSSDWADMETDDVSDTGSNYSSPPPSPPRNSSGASNQVAQSPPDNPAIAIARAMLDEEGEKRVSIEEMCVDSGGPARL